MGATTTTMVDKTTMAIVVAAEHEATPTQIGVKNIPVRSISKLVISHQSIGIDLIKITW
jgi:hypothetical protein